MGIIDEDANGIQYVAEPIGVVLALLPITNRLDALFKSIVAAKTRNALIMRRRRARPLATRAAELCRRRAKPPGCRRTRCR